MDVGAEMIENLQRHSKVTKSAGNVTVSLCTFLCFGRAARRSTSQLFDGCVRYAFLFRILSWHMHIILSSTILKATARSSSVRYLVLDADSQLLSNLRFQYPSFLFANISSRFVREDSS